VRALITQNYAHKDAKTLQVTLELIGGRLAMFQFCPGEQVSGCMV
jgi:hypothetical protein